MKNKYIFEIIKEYETLKDQAQHSQSQRQEEIYKKFPRIRLIDEEIQRTGYEIASSILKGIDVESYILELRKKMTDMKMEKGELLTSNGYPVDYLDISYKCSKCKDTGYIGSEKCSCFKQKLIDRYYQQSNLKDILKEENFDSFNFSLYSRDVYPNEKLSPQKNMEQIYSSCINFVSNFGNEYSNLFFFGGSGLGKTFLSNCIAKDLLDKGRVVIYQTASNLIEMMRSLRFDTDAPKEQLDDLNNCDLLIIDDLGAEPNNTYSQSDLFNIINSRLLLKKSMIISTNLSIGELAKNYPERITSRILGNFTPFKFFGEDIRVQKNVKKIRT